MNELALFAGAGGGILGGVLLGWRTVCAVELDSYARSVLLARQRDGCLPRFPIWDDIRTFDGRPWRGHVDVISGGFPCQDISAAGKGAGITGERSGLWKQMARIVGEVRPRYVFVENSPMLVRRGLGTVLGDLSEMGYDARWGIVGAHHAGAPHKRDRIWVVGHSNTNGFGFKKHTQFDSETLQDTTNRNPFREHADRFCDALADSTGQRRREARGLRPDESTEWIGGSCEDVADALRVRGEAGVPEQEQRQAWVAGELVDSGPGRACQGSWWESEPDVGRVANELADRLD